MYNHNPNVRIDVFTHKGDSFRISDGVSYSSTSPLATPVHTAVFSIRGLTLSKGLGDVSGKPIRDIISNNTLIKCRLADSNGDDWVDFIGSVLRTVEVEVEVGGAPEKRVEVHVEQIAKELMDYIIFWHPHIAAKNNLGGAGWLARKKGVLQSGRPDEVLDNLYKAFINDDYIMRLADGRKLSDVLTTNLEKITDSFAVTPLSALTNESPLWDLLDRYSDQPWNELFVSMQHEKALRESTETNRARFRPSQYADKVGVYLRPTPFDFKDWENLSNTWGWGFEFDESERMGPGINISREEGTVYNFFWTVPKGVYTSFDMLSTLYNQSGGQLPIYDAELIKKYGLRRMEKPTEYVQYVTKEHRDNGGLSPKERQEYSTKTNTLWKLLIKRTLQLYRWFAYEEFWSGSITLRGRVGGSKENGIRQGGILRRKSDGMEFYVTNVQQTYEYPGPHTTTIEVSRGHYPREYRKWWANIEEKRSNPSSVDLSTKLTKEVLKWFRLYP